MKYNYRKAMDEDIRTYFEEEFNNIQETFEGLDKEDAFANYFDELWVVDSVTGNGSGSYTFNRARAEEYVKDNLALCIEAFEEFGIAPEEFGKKVYDEDWEYLDVTIRCYLLGEVLGEVLDELYEELED